MILLGLILGALGVGLPTLRMLKVISGNYIQVFFLSIGATANLYIFTNMVVIQNYEFMISNALGAALSVSYLAYKRQ